MGQPYIEIQVTTSVATSDISFFANGEYVTFTCVAAPATPKLFEYNDGGAADLEASLKLALPSSYQVTRTNDLILIKSLQSNQALYNFGSVVINNVGGDDLTLITQLDDDGLQIVSNGVPTGNSSNQIGVVKINSITHKLPNLYAGVTNPFIFGNIQDVAEVENEFTVIGPLGS